MAALGDLLALHADLGERETFHVQRLVGQWQLLADLSFADLLLWLPTPSDDVAGTPAFVCVAQCRPTTGQTAYLFDEVGSVVIGERAAALNVALAEGRIFQEGEPDWGGDLPVRREAIPVRCDGQVVAVLGRDSNLASARSASQLELVYLQSAADLSTMVADGTFPADTNVVEQGTGPRAGDGLIRIAKDATVLYASPNALSALRRLGVTGNVVGELFGPLGSVMADDPLRAGDLVSAVETALGGGDPGSVEVSGGGATVLFRALPLRPAGEPLGALLLLQDRTELRRRDLALLSKDAMIREIHHRVKNNLQTVAALLRLQARRVVAPEARVALEDSMRRIDSIALVHETLSVSVNESVEFDDIVDRLLPMLADVTDSKDRVAVRRVGSFGSVPAETATSLVLVLTEVVQNATEHAFGDQLSGAVTVEVRRDGPQLMMRIIDDGAGLPPGFAIDASDRLGLQIVRTLISAELGGSFEIAARQDDLRGTEVVVSLTVADGDTVAK